MLPTTTGASPTKATSHATAETTESTAKTAASKRPAASISTVTPVSPEGAAHHKGQEKHPAAAASPTEEKEHDQNQWQPAETG